MLSGAAPATWRGSLPLGGADQARGAGARRASRPPVAARAREPGPLLPRGRGQALVPRAPRRPRRPRGRDRRPGRPPVRPPPGHHHFTVGQRRGIGVANGEPLYVLGTDAAPTPSSSAAARSLATTTVRSATPPCTATAARTGSSSATTRARRSRAGSPGPAGEHAELDLELDEPAYGVAPGPDRVPAGRRPRRRRGTIACRLDSRRR